MWLWLWLLLSWLLLLLLFLCTSWHPSENAVLHQKCIQARAKTTHLSSKNPSRTSGTSGTNPRFGEKIASIFPCPGCRLNCSSHLDDHLWCLIQGFSWDIQVFSWDIQVFSWDIPFLTREAIKHWCFTDSPDHPSDEQLDILAQCGRIPNLEHCLIGRIPFCHHARAQTPFDDQMLSDLK